MCGSDEGVSDAPLKVDGVLQYAEAASLETQRRHSLLQQVAGGAHIVHVGQLQLHTHARQYQQSYRR